MKFAALYQLAQMSYRLILRDILVKAIDDPENDWDDVVISMVDRIFNYS